MLAGILSGIGLVIIILITIVAILIGLVVRAMKRR